MFPEQNIIYCSLQEIEFLLLSLLQGGCKWYQSLSSIFSVFTEFLVKDDSKPKQKVKKKEPQTCSIVFTESINLIALLVSPLSTLTPIRLI